VPTVAVRVVLFTCIAAVLVFCAVQDRVTAAGIRGYVSLQRTALSGQGPATTIDAVMMPAVRRSVRHGLVSSAVVAGAGLSVAAVAARRARRE
jgi:hypothetical protein